MKKQFLKLKWKKYLKFNLELKLIRSGALLDRTANALFRYNNIRIRTRITFIFYCIYLRQTMRGITMMIFYKR